jgi:hypothetical protein
MKKSKGLQSVELGGHISFNHQVGIQLVLVVHDNGDILKVRTQLSVIPPVGLSILLKIFLIREENYFVWIRWFSSGAQRF